MRKWRKMTWVLWIWSGLIVAWMVGGGATADCGSETGDGIISAQTAQDACAAGTGIGIALIALVGFFGFVFLSIIWFMTRPRARACPRCAEDVKKGLTMCPSCGFDYAVVAPAQPPVVGA